MNINLSSVSESPKATKGVASGSDGAEETSESGGFFAKLTAMIKGEGKSEGEVEAVKATQGSEEVEASFEGSSDDAKVTKAQTEGQSSDELLSSDDESAESSKVAADAETADQNNKSDKSNEAVVAKDSSASAKNIVSENEEVLQRLNESSSALQSKDGKELPPTKEVKSDSVDGKSDKTVTAENGAPALAAASARTAKSDDTSTEPNKVETQTVLNDQGEEVEIPVAAKPFIQQSNDAAESDVANVEKVVAKSNSDDGIVVASTAAVAVQGQTKLDSNSLVEQQSSKAVGSEELSQQASSQQVQSQNVEEVGSAELASSAVVAGASVAATSAVASGAMSQQATSGQDPATSTVGVEGSEAVDPTLTAAAPAAAIAWASSSDAPVTDQMAVKPDMAPKAQQAVVAQSVQQALSAQQAQAAQVALQSQASVQNAVAPMPNDLVASQLQQVAAAPNVAVAQDQALLKAALGAKTVGTVGQLAKGSESGQAGQESNFAQQLSQAAGLQTANSATQIRAEQAAAQTPLQLNREMAGDQVAERVQMMMSKNLKNIDIRLDPPELGRMQIRMNMNGDGTTVHFTVANQQARDVIEQSMPRLREMLAQQGVQLNESSVQQQSSGQQQKGYANAGQDNNGQGSGNQGFSGEENLEPDVNLDLNVAAKRDGISYYA
ncbi:flagellar hook-length control protein FliK [Vibrio sp. RE86]|uniref:flagellar hook-length control protein FliK n=1 Tax=Vibrio sp. RE86 TaxID=2607605 RepID=UPI00149396D4|nr:flagellar hook-length control protein FliK [Vibrio sp. RE86]NOH78904.1 flagellar hook-length control protein FliK [Vibrio sp. RE86]